MQPSPTGMRLYDTQGHRLYLTGSERDAFRRAAEKTPQGSPHLLPYLALYRVQALGGHGAHRQPRGFPGAGHHLREP